MTYEARLRHRHLVVGMLLSLALCLAGCTTSIPNGDIVQERFDSPSPALNGTNTLVQSFTSQHDSIHEIELLPAVYGTPGRGALHLRLHSNGLGLPSVAEQRIDVSAIRDGVPIRFVFDPLTDSRGRHYALEIQGEPGVGVGFWYNSVNAYGDGQLTLNNQVTAGDLSFVTRYRYGWRLALAEALDGIIAQGWLVLPLLALLFVPGYVLCGRLTWIDDRVSVAALSLASSLAVVPVALLWSTAFNLRWNRTMCVLAISALTACSVLQLLRRRLQRTGDINSGRDCYVVLAVGGILVATWVLRLLQVRDLVLPAWVDSPQHALVTDLIITTGQVPRTYEPLLPIERFIYHFGFHAINGAFHWLSGLDIPQAMLLLGQALNAASSLMAYALTVRLTRRRAAGVVAALVSGLISYMPAYYVSWGRYTQLTGLLLLSGAVVATLEWLESEAWDRHGLALATLLQAGLILTHARVAVFGACFFAVYLLLQSANCWRSRQYVALQRLWRRAGSMAVMVVLLSGPWLMQVWSGLYSALQASAEGVQAVPSYNVFPWTLLWVPRNRELITVAALGALAGLAQRRKETLWVLGWCGLVALVVNPGWLGLPSLGFVNNATAVIALFVPLAVLVGQAFVILWDHLPTWLSRLTRRDIHVATRAGMALLLALAAVWSAWGTILIVNPVTVLATAEDMDAISWIAENTPADAVFVINARHWQLGTYAGTDGGYWIPQLTGRKTLLPDLSYSYGDPDYVQRIREMAQLVSELKDASDPSFLRLLEEEQVTHIYLGAKGGALKPQMFLSDGRYRTVYSTGAVWIFAVLR
jgi:hypothetical protein